MDYHRVFNKPSCYDFDKENFRFGHCSIFIDRKDNIIAVADKNLSAKNLVRFITLVDRYSDFHDIFAISL